MLALSAKGSNNERAWLAIDVGINSPCKWIRSIQILSHPILNKGGRLN